MEGKSLERLAETVRGDSFMVEISAAPEIDGPQRNNVKDKFGYLIFFLLWQNWEPLQNSFAATFDLVNVRSF